MSVTVLDAVVFVVVLASAVLAMMRGFLREVLSIGSWVAAAIAAYLFYPQLEPFAAQYLGEGIVARAAAIGGIFLVVLLESGVSVTAALLALAAVHAGRFVLRPLLLPIACR